MLKVLPSFNRSLAPFVPRTVPDPSISLCRSGCTSRSKIASGGAGMTRSAATTSFSSLMAVGRSGQSELVPIDVRLPGDEPQALGKPVRRLTRGTRREIDGLAAFATGHVQREAVQRLAGAHAARRLVDHDVLDPGPHAGRYAEDDEREAAHDPSLVIACQQQERAGRRDQLL